MNQTRLSNLRQSEEISEAFSVMERNLFNLPNGQKEMAKPKIVNANLVAHSIPNPAKKRKRKRQAHWDLMWETRQLAEFEGNYTADNYRKWGLNYYSGNYNIFSSTKI